MNIFVYELADGDPAPSPDISPRKLVVEDNVGESIHIHLRNLRLEFTIDEFDRFADNVGIARQQVVDGDR
jgi:hypothetical protein